MKLRKINKKGMSIPLEWIFAMIAGATILILAIYGTTKFVGGAQEFRGKETAEIIKAYLDPYSTGLSIGESAQVSFRKNSKIFFDECSYLENQPWGYQTIAFSETMFNNKFTKKSNPAYIKNKYIFSNSEITGKEVYILSKPFFMGYKVDDLIIVDTKNYCFYNAPRDIKDELENLNINYFNFTNDLDECFGITVCFDINNPECDVIVKGECNNNCETEFSHGKVIKKSNLGKSIELGYINNLWISAIFSNQEIYECNIKRLMNKYYELGRVYLEKIKIIELKGCSSDLQGKLSTSINKAKTIKDSSELFSLYNEVNDIRVINEAATSSGCQLFYS
ncbi:hypothetical protein GOV12_02615 [Candidatus Pacearchaeota archaeon]|nr:hypothetical protein [Candidatus Pacearchaeota archaeon]